MAVGFGAVSVVAIAMSGVLISLVAEVSGLVGDMQHDEAGIKESLALATSVREQYIHQARWLIERDDAHLRHSEEWLASVRARVAALRPLVPASEVERLDSVARDSLALDALFRDAVRPAARAGDTDELVRLHRQADAMSYRATTAADAVARAVEARMARAHTSATRATRLGLLTGAIGVALVLALSVMFTMRLRRAVLIPLDVLARAARRFGAGDSSTRVGQIGDGELLAVAHAFDHMAEELQRREQKLIESERMAAIGQLAAGVAHEINNPIQVIRGYLETMGPDTPDETLVEELQILDEEAAACQRIAEDLVAYSRSPDIKPESVAIADFVAETIRRFQETPEGSERPIDVDVERAVLHIDRTRLRQVVLNLLRNAAQATDGDVEGEIDGDAEGREPTPQRIEVRGQAADGGYELSVSDRGPGIDDRDKLRVFEPFFSQRPDGSGLGLAVCRGIIHAHEGVIEARDRAGGGAVMWVFLPHTARGGENA